MRFLVVVLAVLGTGVWAQDAETLADIRQELTVLNVEIQKLKRELSTTGASGSAATGGSVLARVDALEAEVRRLTGQTEALAIRVERVVEDGTRRVGDLEFRLVELEGGDVGALGETSTLGGAAPAGAPQVTTPEPAAEEPATQMAVGEERDYTAAVKALEGGDAARAVELLTRFNEVYPGSPLGVKAQLKLGEAYDAQGETKSAARAYLDAFRLAPTGEDAPEALFRLGRGLGRLGQTKEACTTLGEVGARFPGGEPAAKAAAERGRLGCS